MFAEGFRDQAASGANGGGVYGLKRGMGARCVCGGGGWDGGEWIDVVGRMASD